MSTVQIKGEGTHLVIDVMRYENPNAVDSSDANWLAAAIEVKAGLFQGRYNASLTTHDFSRFKDEVDALLEGKKSEAIFFTDEGWLRLQFTMNARGGVKGVCEASANDALKSNLRFCFESDQTSLAEMRNGVAEVVRSFPVKG